MPNWLLERWLSISYKVSWSISRCHWQIENMKDICSMCLFTLTLNLIICLLLLILVFREQFTFRCWLAYTFLYISFGMCCILKLPPLLDFWLGWLERQISHMLHGSLSSGQTCHDGASSVSTSHFWWGCSTNRISNLA